MPQPIIPLDDFLTLTSDEQVEKLKYLKMDYTLKDIHAAWGFNHSAKYYFLLKKLRIYDRVVNKSDKFYPDKVLTGKIEVNAHTATTYSYSKTIVPSDHFNYELNVTLSGAELADKLERLAYFLKGEQKAVSIKLMITASEYDSFN